MEQHGKDGNVENIQGVRNKTLMGIDKENIWSSAIVAQNAQVDPFAANSGGREINNFGFNRVLVNPDLEPSIIALLEAVEN